MPRNGRFREQVYLAFCDILEGERTLMRRPGSIRRFIEANTHDAEIRRLVEKHGIQFLGATVNSLLEDQVFDSVRTARAHFPNAFQTPPTRNAVPAAAEPFPSQEEDIPPQSIPERHLEQLDAPHTASTSTEAVPHLPLLTRTNTDPSTGPQNPPETTHVSTEESETQPEPMPFPFQVQHHIFMKVQFILEGACYAFAKIELPHVLSERKWDCPEAGELDRWTMVLLYYERERVIFDQNVVASLEKPLVEFMRSVARFRHDTVHRAHLTADKVLEYLNDAELFVKLLKDKAARGVVSEIRRQVEAAVMEMMRNRNMLNIWTDHTNTYFAAARAQLDFEESEALSMATQRHVEFDTWACTDLLQAVTEISGVPHP